MPEPLAFAYLNGAYLALAEAQVSVLDRGFLFGDGVYEVIPVYGGKLFEFHAHLRRLARSLRAIKLTNPHDDQHWQELLGELVQRNGGGDQALYLQVTRGADTGRDHGFPHTIKPTVFAMSSVRKPVPEKILARGVAATTQDDIRWRRSDIKSISLLANVLLRQRALDAHVDEVILLREGFATEGSVTSLFVCYAGQLITPPLGPDLLPGITREVVQKLARRHELGCVQARISRAMLDAADEIWLTSSTREVLPVTQLNDTAVGAGVPGPRWREMHALFQDYKLSDEALSNYG